MSFQNKIHLTDRKKISYTQVRMIKWWDAHSHWADSRLDSTRDEWIKTALNAGLEFTLMGGVGPEDWKKQKQLKLKHPDLLGLCFGLHPEWVASRSELELNEALDLLSKEVSQAQALGETGLDLRPQFEESLDLQMEAFEAQLEMAKVAHKPVVLHLVRAHEEAMKAFQFFEPPPRGALVHSFNGSWPQAQDYLDMGFLISVGGPLLKPENFKLFEVVQRIPENFLVIETDLPDQAWGPYRGSMNPPESLLAVAGKVAQIRKISQEDVLHFTTQNLKTWLK